MRKAVHHKHLSYTDLISKAREKREIEYKKLACFTLSQLKRATNASLQEISYQYIITDPSACFNHSALIYTLIKLRNDHYQKLLSILKNLKPQSDTEVEIFIQFVYSKLIKHLNRSDVQNKLIESIDQLASADSSIAHAYFLKFLAEHSPNSILFCTVQFIKATKKSIYHRNIKIKHVGYEALKLFLQFLIRIQTPQMQPSVSKLIFSANRKSKSNTTIHGALLIFSALFETAPTMISAGYDESLTERLYSNFSKYTPDLRGLALNVLVFLWIFDPKSFQNRNFDIVKSTIWKETASAPTQFSTVALLRLVQKDRSIYSYGEVIPAIQSIMRSTDKKTLKNGYSILKDIANVHSDYIQNNISAFVSALINVIIDENFVTNVPSLFVQFPSLWLSFKPLMQRNIRRAPEILQSTPVLILLSKCPSLDDPQVTSELLALCDSPSNIIRGFVPDAILAQIKMNSQSDRDVIDRLFMMALSDPIPFVREKVLLAFPDRCIEFLTSESIIESLSSLIKDESNTVRTASIRLIGKIAKYNPFLAYPILRRELLDTLFILDSPKPLLAKADMAACFSELLTATFDVLMVYSQTLCDITLRQISFTPTRELTFFEQRAIQNINLNLTKAIGLIAEHDIRCLSQHTGQFLNFFMWMLQQHGPKELKLAVVTTMYSILTHSGTVADVEVSRVFPSLIDIASMWNSRKLNLAVLKLMGFIGAIDIFEKPMEDNQSTQEEHMPHNKEGYLMATACRTLLNVIGEDSLIVHHKAALNALVDIFCSDLTSGVEFFNEFMNIFLDKIKNGNAEEYLAVLRKLCAQAPPDWVTNFSADLLELIQKLWDTTQKPLLLDIIELIPVLAQVLVDRFTPHLPQCTSFLLNILYTNASIDVDLSNTALMAMIALRNISYDYLFLIFPEIISAATSKTTSSSVRCQTLIALRVLVQTCNCYNFASPLIRCTMTCLAKEEPEVKQEALQLIYSLMLTLKPESFAFYAQFVRKSILAANLPVNGFDEIFNSNERKIENFEFVKSDDPSIYMTVVGIKKQEPEFDQMKLVMAFNFQEDETPWNRKEWWHNLVATTLECSPSHFIRCCAFLSTNLFHVAEGLFNAAFLSCWNAMDPEVQCTISGCLTCACLSDPLPNAIRSSLVKLFEYMEQSEKKLEIEYSVLLSPCETALQYGKALYFAHRNFYKDPNDLKSIENLIHLSSRLGLTKTVAGLSLYVKNRTMEPYWCEQLGQWEKAKQIYISNTDPRRAGESFKGVLRCLKHQKKYDEIIDKMGQFVEQTPVIRAETLPTIASALFKMRQWDKLGSILEYCPRNKVSVLMIVALSQANEGKQQEAMKTIAQAFDILARNARSVFKHDKVALYPLLVKAQQLHEISEIVSGKSTEELATVWNERIKHCRESFDVYHRILSVRLAHLDVSDMMKPAIKMLKFALKRKDIASFDSAFQYLFPNEEEWNDRVEFLYIQGMWARGDCINAVVRLKNKLRSMKVEKSPDISRMFYMCGHWMLQIPLANSQDTLTAVRMLEMSIKCDPSYYNAWHRWSWANSAMYRKSPNVQEHAINAISGFQMCLKLRTGNTFSDLIQMVMVIFTAKLSPEAFAQIRDRINTIDKTVFLQVIPQLFAQLARPNNQVHAMAADFIAELLPVHFHVLLYPLLLLTQTPLQTLDESLEESIERSPNQTAADILSNFMEENSVAAVEGKTVSDGLLLCSSSRIEAWQDAVGLAMKAVNRHDNTSARNILFQAYSIPARPGEHPATEKYGEYIKQMHDVIATGNFDGVKVISELQTFYKTLKKHLENIRQVNMYLVAPSLAQLRDAQLAIPGTYTPDEPITAIHQFHPTLDVYYSKQRPRVLTIADANGGTHRSLLKGREDLRLDQRVMQFFLLINQHINHDFHPESRSLSIFRYTITPISKTAGLIQYVDGADTMYSLVSEYRRDHDRDVFEERTFIESNMVKTIDALTPIQRYEALCEATAATPDSDLREILWLKSPSSNEWVSRYIRFAQSSALMSIIGYIIGLGDRHPSNLMIHRYSGSVIHIDFSDCFEISRNRVRFPELIPFRLTRMMVCAFGPTGIEGDFRITCEETLRLVRSHRESIMAVLDIFLQEPLDGFDSNNAENEEDFEEEEDEEEEEDAKRMRRERSHGLLVDVNEGFSPDSLDSDAGASIHESMTRLNNKIIGRDFEKSTELSIPQQVERLLGVASDMYLKAYLYTGWTPLW